MMPAEVVWDGDFYLDAPRSILVMEDDASPTPTGLLDASGTPIYRLVERIKVGFVQ